MPFFDNTGVHTEEHRGPFLSAFAILLDQVERMIALNITWTLQILPLAAFFAFPQLPMVVRVLFLLYTGAVLIPATAVLFGLAARAMDGELLRLELALDLLRELTPRALLVLAPLYSLFAWLLGLALLAQNYQLVMLDVLARLALLFFAVFALYWGPLFAANPAQTAVAVLRQSVRLVWRRPAISLWASLIVGLVWLAGAFSIGGLVLLAPVLAALLQTGYYRAVTAPREIQSGSQA